MNYKKIYEDLIFNAKSQNRQKFKKTNNNYIYYENHHILPKCLGGDDNDNNKVLLTAREHFIAHKLLVFIYSNNKNLVYACVRLVYSKTGDLIKCSRDYEFIKHLLAKIPMSQETRDKISKTQRGIIRSEEFKEKQRQSHKGTRTGEKCNFIRYIKENRKGKTLREEMIKIYGEDEGEKRHKHWIDTTAAAHSKPILQLDKNDNIIKEWPSIKAANDKGFMGTNICACLKGKRNTHKNYKWRYK